MNELKPCPCPICGAALKIYRPEDWSPSFCDPDSGGDPYNAVCDCGFSFSTGTYDYAAFVSALNRRAQPANEPLTLEDLRETEEVGEPIYVGRCEAEYSGMPIFKGKRYVGAVLDKIVAFGAENYGTTTLQAIYGRNLTLAESDYGKTWTAYRRKPEGSESDGQTI